MGNPIIDNALSHAHDTRSVVIERGAHNQLPDQIRSFFSDDAVFLVADENTYRAAGEDVTRALADGGISLSGELIFPGLPRLKPDILNVQKVQQALEMNQAVPLVVGSGTLNDIVKLAAHRVGRAYLAVGTAASMDGYTSFAAAITHEGVKKVDPCPAPRVFVADPDVFTQAPTALSSSGYADLIAKVNSGADWIIADFVGSEVIQQEAWTLIQPRLRRWLEDPDGIPEGDATAIEHLMVGLVMAGLAMQAARSSWPASGSEHLFSHLWEMRGLPKKDVSHGYKVGLGTLAASALVAELLEEDLHDLDIDARCQDWPPFEEIEARIQQNFEDENLVQTCIAETHAKYLDMGSLGERLEMVSQAWAELSAKIGRQMMRPLEIRDRLVAAGCPTFPAEIGLELELFQQDYARIRYLRARYTSFDLAAELGLLERLIDELFSDGGYWSTASV